MPSTHRVAIVTGASRGLGLVLARVLAGRGYDLVIGARDPGPLARAADSLRPTGARVETVAGDVTTASVRDRLVQAARDLGGLDLLVNNASELGGVGPLTSFDVASLERIFPVNVDAPLAL